MLIDSSYYIDDDKLRELARAAPRNRQPRIQAVVESSRFFFHRLTTYQLSPANLMYATRPNADERAISGTDRSRTGNPDWTSTSRRSFFNLCFRLPQHRVFVTWVCSPTHQNWNFWVWIAARLIQWSECFNRCWRCLFGGLELASQLSRISLCSYLHSYPTIFFIAWSATWLANNRSNHGFISDFF